MGAPGGFAEQGPARGDSLRRQLWWRLLSATIPRHQSLSLAALPRRVCSDCRGIPAAAMLQAEDPARRCDVGGWAFRSAWACRIAG